MKSVLMEVVVKPLDRFGLETLGTFTSHFHHLFYVSKGRRLQSEVDERVRALIEEEIKRN